MVITEELNSILLVTLNRPTVHNAIDERTMTDLEQLLEGLQSRTDIRVVVLTGSGDTTFCAGGDLRYFATLQSRQSCLEMTRRMQHILQSLYRGPRPVIAAINGQALGGGCEIMTACHLRIAADHATFAFRQAPNGIVTGWGGGSRLLSQLPVQRALFLVLTGNRIDAQQALALGLINQVVPADQLLKSALVMAGQIAANPEPAVRSFLDLARLASVEEATQKMIDLETERFADLWMGADFRQVVDRYREP